MESVSTRLSSPRFQRYMLWLGVIVFAAGALTLVFVFVNGNDDTPTRPDKGFHAQLPARSIPLKNSDGVLIKTYTQLDPGIRQAVRTFIATVVARKNVDASWPVIAPSLRKGYTRTQWGKAAALPVIPYPGVDTKNIQYYLDYASTKEILVEVGLAGKQGVSTRPVTFMLGLVPVGKGHWAVDYWMPRWTPPVQQGN